MKQSPGFSGRFTSLRVRPLRVLRNFYKLGYLFVRAADIAFPAQMDRLVLEDQSLHIVSAPGQHDFLKNRFEIEVASFDAALSSSHALVRRDGAARCIINYLSTDLAIAEDVEQGTLTVPKALYSALSEQVKKTGWF